MPTSYRNPSAPLDRGFNAAVLTMATRLFPTGYDVGPDAPQTLQELNDHISKTGRMLVWNGASDQTIFDDQEVNWAFRAWHDWCHWRHQYAFDLDGEKAAAEEQISHLYEVFGAGPQVKKWAAIIWAEVVGQAQHLAETGQFPADQMEFTRNALAECHFAEA